jgi:ABC-type hemin transport system substrate-binding protein
MRWFWAPEPIPATAMTRATKPTTIIACEANDLTLFGTRLNDEARHCLPNHPANHPTM